MEHVIEFSNVNVKLDSFELKDISMSVKKGLVTGFIGGNGAGKSTIIKLMMNILKPDQGEIKLFGLDYRQHEKAIKQRIGFVYDDNVFYEQLTMREMKKIIKPIYHRCDDKLFLSYMESFQLPLDKKINTFSKGMMMKASLAIALSHHAELIIMDEPTSGLDPIFRRELLDILHDIMQDGEKTVFFSTHITTDLDKIADYITFIHNGELVFTSEMYKIFEQYTIVKGGLDLLDSDVENEFIALRKSMHGFEGLSANRERVESLLEGFALVERATLEDIMYYTQKQKGAKKVG